MGAGLLTSHCTISCNTITFVMSMAILLFLGDVASLPVIQPSILGLFEMAFL